MKRFFRWAATIVGVGVAGVFAFRAIQIGREKVKRTLGEAEAVADRTREVLEQTESALRKTREAI